MAEIQNAVTMEDFNALNAELEEVRARYEATATELEQYKEAYKAQAEKYNRLFGLFANNVDYFISGKATNN